jgi:hypothetical protein
VYTLTTAAKHEQDDEQSDEEQANEPNMSGRIHRKTPGSGVSD